MGWGDDYNRFPKYVSVAERKAKALHEVAKLAKRGHVASPVVVQGRKIATTFWGKAWNANLEVYSDFASRLPRGRSYCCNGSVVDLKIEPGLIKAMVAGTHLYEVEIKIEPLDKAAWEAVKRQCAGQIGSLVELLQGKLSKSVMEVVTAPGTGLFPEPNKIRLSCSCADYADMCKHVAAVLYGVGSRLDAQPELLFTLRKVDQLELLAAAGEGTAATKKPGKSKRLAASDLSDVFGIEMEVAPPEKATKKKGNKKKA